MVNLGFWQLRRLDERRDFNAVVEARYDETPVPLGRLLDDLADGTDPGDIEWRPVSATGTYLPDETFSVVNRSQNGRAGRNVVVPLRLDDGHILLVNRGFVPLQIDDAPEVPAIETSLIGRVRESQERSLGQLRDPAEGDLVEAQRIDIDRLAAQLPGDVVPVYVDLAVAEPAELPGLPEPVAPPDLGEGNHLSYAFQWFVFSICVLAGWVIVTRRSAKTHRASGG
jgi:cytochrome oxidase assembly protein ShyY1